MRQQECRARRTPYLQFHLHGVFDRFRRKAKLDGTVFRLHVYSATWKVVHFGVT